LSIPIIKKGLTSFEKKDILDLAIIFIFLQN
jgi:hypothetical protein